MQGRPQDLAGGGGQKICFSKLKNSHSKKYHKYITNIPQIYHKSTTKCDIVSQKCDIVPQKCDIVPQKCDIVPQKA